VTGVESDVRKVPISTATRTSTYPLVLVPKPTYQWYQSPTSQLRGRQKPKTFPWNTWSG